MRDTSDWSREKKPCQSLAVLLLVTRRAQRSLSEKCVATDIKRAMLAPVAREVGSLSLRKQTSNGNYASLTATFDSSPPSDSTLLFASAMAQIKTPKTAFATTSATEYPICSPAVAVTPEMPNILIMYTKG